MTMREILFRGKDEYTGKWVYGFYYFKRSRYAGDKTFVYEHHTITTGIEETRGAYGETTDTVENNVIPETVGQYTGLTDKNGKKIFEGDIVKITDTIVDFETTAYIKFGNPNGLYNWGWQLVPLQKMPFAVEILHWVEMEEAGAYIEVIGNIHDNHELLGGDTNV